ESSFSIFFIYTLLNFLGSIAKKSINKKNYDLYDAYNNHHTLIARISYTINKKAMYCEVHRFYDEI
ncbi:hypothetical protein, partial [Segatella albensis]|uniref:hypothetical protein n=1 Tax=Segatella albensis TaxID=77768 RepID=UPI00056586EE